LNSALRNLFLLGLLFSTSLAQAGIDGLSPFDQQRIDVVLSDLLRVVRNDEPANKFFATLTLYKPKTAQTTIMQEGDILTHLVSHVNTSLRSWMSISASSFAGMELYATGTQRGFVKANRVSRLESDYVDLRLAEIQFKEIIILVEFKKLLWARTDLSGFGANNVNTLRYVIAWLMRSKYKEVEDTLALVKQKNRAEQMRMNFLSLALNNDMMELRLNQTYGAQSVLQSILDQYQSEAVQVLPVGEELRAIEGWMDICFNWLREKTK